MKKMLIGTCALLLVLGTVGNASAIPFKDLDTINKTITATTQYNGTFDIANGDGGAGDIPGYSATLYDLTTASVEFKFEKSGSKMFAAVATITDWSEGFAGTPTQGGKEFTEALNPNVWADLSADGNLTYTLSIVVPNTLFDTSYKLISAALTVEATEKPQQPVPEPATMLLLGSGLVGLAGFGRKKLFKKG